MRQVKVDKEKRKAFLDLNSCFYPVAALKETEKAFKEICTVKTGRKGNRRRLELRFFPGVECREAALSFLNYALGASKEMR